jgi:hypothetical protein
MPTTPTNVFGAQGLTPLYDAARAKQIHVKIPVSTTIVRGTILGELTAAPGTFKAYATGNVDGSENAKAIMAYDVVSDASGAIKIGGAEHGETSPSCPVFIQGFFRTTELTGLDTGAVTKLGRLATGILADGVLLVTGA